GGLQQAPRCLDAVHPRHAYVHQHDVRAGHRQTLERLGAVAGLADDLHVVLAVDQHRETCADHLLVVDQEDPDRGRDGAHSGILPCTRQPPPTAGPVSRRPPCTVTRSAMPTSPSPALSDAAAAPCPSSTTSIWISSASRASRSLTWAPAPACLRTLVKAS